MNQYKCSAGLIVIFPIIFFAGFGLLEYAGNPVYAFGSLFLAFFIFYGRPTSISVDENCITVNQKIFQRTINFSDIQSVKKVGFMDYMFTWTMRMNRLCSQLDNFVMIEMVKKSRSCVFVSPDDREAFLADIAERYPEKVVVNDE